MVGQEQIEGEAGKEQAPFRMPVLFKARMMDDGFGFIVCLHSDIRGFELGIKDGTVRINLDRESMAALRDVLTATLEQSNATAGR